MAVGFAYSFPFSFVFGDEELPFVELPDGEIERVESHCEDAKSLLIDQFRGRPRIEAMICALLVRAQEVDNAAWRVLTERTIDRAIGVQLDGLGELVGQARRGFGDETYRVLIRARVLANRSDGSTESIYAVILAALGNPGWVVAEVRRYGNASILVRLAVPADFDETVINDLVQDSKSGGVRAVVLVPMAPAANVLRFSSASDSPTYNADAGLDSSATPDTGTGALSRAMSEAT